MITANKLPLSSESEGDAIFRLARRQNLFVGYSAAITGCHHFIRAIASSVMIRSLGGVYNSTSNYTLTQIENGDSFKEALRKAQDEGYAEEDPSNDDDRYHKLSANRPCRWIPSRRKIEVRGVRDITRRRGARA